MKGRIGWVKENHAQKTNRLPSPNLLSFIITNTQLNTFHTESWEPIWASCNYLRYNTCCWTSCIQPWRSSVLFLRTFDMMALTACSLLGLLYTLETLKKGYKDADSSTCQRHPVIEIMLMPCWQAQKVPKIWKGMPWTAVVIQVNILPLLEAPDTWWESIKNRPSTGCKTF